MAVTIRITETYDMKTSVGRMGLIGIHTPKVAQINKLYPGLINQYKFMRLVKCDIAGACASVLPADPKQIGVESGDIAPEDMFNPILYKPVSNESFETIVARIYGQTDVSYLGSVNTGNLNMTTDEQFQTYYGLLASKGWLKAMPQRGFALRGLVPICHTLVSSYGNLSMNGFTNKTTVNDTLSTATNSTNAIVPFRGRPVRMPRLPTHVASFSGGGVPNADGSAQSNFEFIPTTFCAVLITPPARLNEFYYRMRVTWTIRFENLVPSTEFMNASGIQTVGQRSYQKGWTEPSAKSIDVAGTVASLPNETDTIDTVDVSINKIMES